MSFDLSEATALLARTPSVLRALLDGLDDAWIQADEGPNTWSAFDNLGHLIHGERTDWLPRVHIILQHGPDRPFDPFDRFAQERESVGKTLGDLLDEFETLRAERLEELEGLQLTREQLDLEGTHPELGRVTLRHLLAAWTVHDLGHIAQISRVMAKRYRDDLGPWPRYLPIVTR